ncbi:MAG: RNA methyltransferase [Chitinophagales bacterium]|nr:RNA methyltransferase [Chitinophagales bacterium]
MRKLEMEELNRMSVDEYKNLLQLPVVVVMDNVRSGHNVGSVFRTGDAFRVATLYLCGITATPPNREVMKTALGSSDSVPWRYFHETHDALEELKQQGYEVCFIEQTTQSISLNVFFPSKEKKYALVFGNEVEGIQSNLFPLGDRAIEIPQFGTKHSFNIAVAAGIVLWDFWMKLKLAI